MSEEEQFEPPLSQAAPGQLLAEGREARGWSVAEVAMRLKFATRQIEALEADAYHALPGPAIVRGMVRSYAKALGMNPQPLVADLEHRLNNDPLTLMAPRMGVPLLEAKKGTRLYVGLSVLVLAVLAGFVVQWWMEKSRTTAAALAPVAAESENETSTPVPVDPPVESVETSSTQVEPPQPIELAKAVPGQKRVEFVFSGDAWVEVTDGSGKVLSAQLHSAQTQSTVEGKPPFSLVVGNAASVHLVYDGNPVDMRPSTRNDVARLKLN